MSILIDENTRVLVQGITGRIGQFHCEQMLKYGTNVVAGVSPGRAGEEVHGVPVFNTVSEAVASSDATASIVIVPPPFASDAIMESAEAGVRLAVSITDGIPAQDMIRVKRYMRRYREDQKMRLLGPNCAGVISPGKSLLGIMPAEIFDPGEVGLVGRSGTLGYEAAAQMQSLGIGISSSVGIGGDPISGSTFVDILKLFNDDDQTKAIVMVGEIGGSQEAEAASFIKEHVNKPVIAYVAGSSAPPRKAMGHAGAIISAFGESADEKVEVLREVGAVIVPNPSDIGVTVAEVVKSI
ncbi:MAG: succinate--CoA ligase subunit alpha [Granulosicoccus sp.]|nr:succinate--CoA ligase subunit alpha [Granulosicoccus sp.]